MTRIVDPPRDQFKKLPTPLEAGERKVIDLFDRKLPPKWEIYVQPHLNGLRPDIVLLHPDVGVAVFEVKDWDLGAMRYYAKEDETGNCALWARHQNGTSFSRERETTRSTRSFSTSANYLTSTALAWMVQRPLLSSLPDSSSPGHLVRTSSVFSDRSSKCMAACENTRSTTRSRARTTLLPATSVQSSQ